MSGKRRTFAPEYKAEAVGLVRDGEKSISAVAKDLGLSDSALRRWVLQSETDAGRGDPKELTTPERAELAQLRRDIRQLRMERDLLKKATAFDAPALSLRDPTPSLQRPPTRADPVRPVNREFAGIVLGSDLLFSYAKSLISIPSLVMLFCHNP
jgi:transposase